ncbi:MAG: Sua5/YciO/YrdC/YwlC family protein [Acidobacteriota bacterium]
MPQGDGGPGRPEPIACPSCGPRLWLVDAGGETVAEGYAAIEGARREILAGAVVAVKGLGGFQLACRADSEEAVARLRRRKRRPGKPFAVMVRDLEALRTLVDADQETESLLSSPRSPIALAPRRRPSAVAEAVAPGLEDIGVMLPTTPLHVELLRDPTLPPLVMTSGNLSEEPLCRSNRAAVAGLRDIADVFLLHDRDVVRRIDDSVVRSSVRGPMMVRRARGWVPEPLALPVETPAVIVAVGGHLQVTACVAHGDQAFLSQHIGDLDNTAARQFHQEVIEGLLQFLQVEPELVACDAHPDYPSSWLAQQLAERSEAELVPVQHHLAHAAAVMAEYGRFPEAGERHFGVSLDGTGWGPDGTAWGGEWIELGGDLSWSRLAHLERLPLVGGEAAVREPWRVAVAALVRAGREELLAATPMGTAIEPDRLRQMVRLAGDGTWPLASGATTTRGRPRHGSKLWRSRPQELQRRGPASRSRTGPPAACCRRRVCSQRRRNGSRTAKTRRLWLPVSTRASAGWQPNSRSVSVAGGRGWWPWVVAAWSTACSASGWRRRWDAPVTRFSFPATSHPATVGCPTARRWWPRWPRNEACVHGR